MKIRTAILGYGRSGSTLHADPLEKLTDDFEVVAVCDIDPAALAKAGARFHCALYDDYRAMLAKEKLDLLVIVTRSHQHAAMTCAGLRAGVNVLVTKPWALNARQAERMMAAAAASGRQLLPWLPARWGCDLTRLRELIAGGAVGRVFMVRRREFSFGLRTDWQTERKCGGGYLLNWGPHIVDQAVQLAGEPVVSAYGHLRQVINPGDVEDVFFAVLKTASGTLLNCEFTLAVDRLPNWVVQGDRGTIYVKETSLEIHRVNLPEKIDPLDYRTRPTVTETREELTETHRITMSNRYGDPFAIYPDIARALRGEKPYAVTPASALDLTRILDAIRRSSERDKVVALPR